MKNLKKLNIFMFIFSLAFVLVACGNTNKTENEKVANINGEKIIDREGKEIDLPKNTDTIISLLPSTTETLINLGLGDKIIGVDQYSKELEGLKSDIAVFDIVNPDLESIIALKSDIILGILPAEGVSNPYETVRKTGSFVASIPTPITIQGIFDDILFIGKVTNTEEKANEIVDTYKKEMENIVKKVDEYNKDTQQKNKPKFYFEISQIPFAYTFGKDTFLNEMLEKLQVENVFGDLDGWNGVSEEDIVKRNPDIIFTNAGYVENPTDEIKSRAGWDVLSAIKNDRVYYIDENNSSRPNENTIKAFKQMAEAIYPEIDF